MSGVATLQVSPAVVAANGDNVTVSWSGVGSPSDADWIAFYAPTSITILLRIECQCVFMLHLKMPPKQSGSIGSPFTTFVVYDNKSVRIFLLFFIINMITCSKKEEWHCL